MTGSKILAFQAGNDLPGSWLRGCGPRPFCLEDVLDEMAKKPNLEEMRTLLFEIREHCGLANVVYHALRIPGCEIPNPVAILSYDMAWVNRYLSENYLEIDPVIAHSLRGARPLDWADIDRRDPAVSHLFREGESYGIGRQGCTIPVRGANGERAVFTFTSNLSDSDWQKRRFQLIRDYHILAHFFHEQAIALSGYRVAPTKLSYRELQCIQMLAGGAQLKVIAFELGISENAVNLYTKSARHKLRSATTAQAVAEAVRREII